MYILRELNRFKENIKEEFKGEWSDLNEEYLTQFNVVRKEHAFLPVDVAMDDWKIYKKVGFPMSFFFRNSYLSEIEEWFPIDITNPYKMLFEHGVLNICLDDYFRLCEFVNNYKEPLIEMANDEGKLLAFLNKLSQKNLTESKVFLTEMANLPPSDTGLKQRIWLDLGQTYKKGGHWLRIKVNTPDGDATLTIPSMEWIGGEMLKEPEKKIIEKYVKINMDVLTKVLMGQIDFPTYKAFSIKVDSKGLPISKFDVKKWCLFGTLNNGIKVYRKNALPIKFFITNDDKNSLFNNEDGQAILFDNISEIDSSGKFCIGRIGEEKYMITASSKLINLKEFYDNQ